MNLEEVDNAAWSSLTAAVDDPQSGFRFINLCSVDQKGHPQARMVVLRRTERTERLLEIQTDTRSPKWIELFYNPFATVLGFCPVTRVQLRLAGTVRLHPSGSILSNQAWSKLSAWTQSTYSGGPHGDEQGHGGTIPVEGSPGDEGKAVFGVVMFSAESLDWFQLGRPNRRAILTYDNVGELTASRWMDT